MTENELNQLIQAKVYEQVQKYKPNTLMVAAPWIATALLLTAITMSHFWHAHKERQIESAVIAQGKLVLETAGKTDSLSRTVGHITESIAILVRGSTGK